jgi:hypothetical protein
MYCIGRGLIANIVGMEMVLRSEPLLKIEDQTVRERGRVSTTQLQRPSQLESYGLNQMEHWQLSQQGCCLLRLPHHQNRRPQPAPSASSDNTSWSLERTNLNEPARGSSYFAGCLRRSASVRGLSCREQGSDPRDVPVGKARQGHSKERIFGLQIDCHCKLVYSVVRSFLFEVEHAQIYMSCTNGRIEL